ncbi:hypothetical protein BIW11_02987 [Tropilaelaps mercedesae]|uniref:Uncharacterized protein n=1 Tax=Tropilaelaps mercedesae TaxID=418985 RepID=A0A1V9XTZ0_9ACAR|nr:hypothetical protein BIW11_02987 [Tropilaelaps mercedesae]
MGVWQARDDADTLLQSTRQETMTQRLAQVQLADVVFTYKTKFFIYRKTEIQLRCTLGKGKVSKPVVTSCNDRSAEDLANIVIVNAATVHEPPESSAA